MIRTPSDSLSTQTGLANKKGTTKWLSDEMSILSERAAGRQTQREKWRDSCRMCCASTLNAHALYTEMGRDANLITNTGALKAN